MIELDEKTKLTALKDFMETRKTDEYHESHLIGILHKAQELYGYLSQEIMQQIALEMQIPAAKIWGVASFYHYFNLKPVGKHIISVCLGTACYVKGAGRILDRLQEDLNLKIGETSQDRLFSLHEARCLGACGLAPVVMIGDRIHGNLTPDRMSEIVRELKKD